MPQRPIIGNHARLAQDAAYPAEIKVNLRLEADSGRSELENYISNKYFDVHGARVHEYLPILVGIYEQAELAGAFGLRPGRYRPMFLEQYLDAPIEQQVASFSKQPVDRRVLIEIGNLAITKRGHGFLAMLLLAMSLQQAGYEWMVFTVTEQVEHIMKRLGFEPHYLASADPSRLVSSQSSWGSYYDNNPRVMVGSLKDASTIVANNARFSHIAQQQGQNITDIALTLSEYRRLAGDS